MKSLKMSGPVPQRESRPRRQRPRRERRRRPRLPERLRPGRRLLPRRRRHGRARRPRRGFRTRRRGRRGFRRWSPLVGPHPQALPQGGHQAVKDGRGRFRLRPLQPDGLLRDGGLAAKLLLQLDAADPLLLGEAAHAHAQPHLREGELHLLRALFPLPHDGHQSW